MTIAEKALDRIHTIMSGWGNTEDKPAAESIELNAEDIEKAGETVEVELEQKKTEEGGIVLDADKFEPGEAVFVIQDEQKIPVPEGVYGLEDGSTITVDDQGIITDVKAAGETEEATEEAAPEAEAEMAETKSPAAQQVAKKLIESSTQTRETVFSKEDSDKIKTMLSEFDGLKAKVDELEAAKFNLSKENEELKKRLESEPAESTTFSPNADPVKVDFHISADRMESTEDRIMSMIS